MPRRKTSHIIYISLTLIVLTVASIALALTYQSSYPSSPPPGPISTTTTSTEKPSLQTTTQGQPAPAFTLRIIDGDGLRDEVFTFNPSSGRVVFIEFVFEWCPHCRNMAPIIERIYSGYGDRVVFISVAGGYNTDPQKTAGFIRQYGISWTVLYDPQLEVFRKYGVRYTPSYFIISPDGVVLAGLAGEQPYETLTMELDRALRQG
jgi:thiol-disulfide isomerase/thioredoxin